MNRRILGVAVTLTVSMSGLVIGQDKPASKPATPPTRAWMSPAAPAAGPTLLDDGSGYALVNFFQIADFDYNPKEPYAATPRQFPGTIPPWIKALDGKRVSLSGLVTILDWDKYGASSQFILLATADVCGFGATPRLNEWVYVSMAGGKRVPVYKFQIGNITTVKGVFHVEEQVETGFVVGLFSIVADSAQ